MIEEIKAVVMEDDEIFESVPGFKTEEVEGENEITYFNGKQDVKLDELTDDALGELFEQVTAVKKKLDDKWQKQDIETSIEAQKKPPRPPEPLPRLSPQPPPQPPKR